MSTFEYIRPGEALRRAGEHARDFEKIIGLYALDAGRIRPALTRTRAGNMRTPKDTWRAHAQLGEFRPIAEVVRTRDDGSGEDADPGTVTVRFADGTHTYLHHGDLLCVEQPIGGMYEKCRHCHLFIELNPAAENDPAVSVYDHMSRGDAADERITGTHDAEPSGIRGSLAWWKAAGPPEMVARFN